MSAHASGLFPVLLGILSDNSDEVVLQGLIVLAEIVNTTNTTGRFFYLFPEQLGNVRFSIEFQFWKFQTQTSTKLITENS